LTTPLELPLEVGDKTVEFPEWSYGAMRATLILRDGRRVPNVFLAWGRQVVKIGDRQISAAGDLGFALDDVVDAEVEDERT